MFFWPHLPSLESKWFCSMCGEKNHNKKKFSPFCSANPEIIVAKVCHKQTDRQTDRQTVKNSLTPYHRNCIGVDITIYQYYCICLFSIWWREHWQRTMAEVPVVWPCDHAIQIIACSCWKNEHLQSNILCNLINQLLVHLIIYFSISVPF